MQILGLLGMFFDAVVVEVEKSLLFFQIGSGHTVQVIEVGTEQKSFLASGLLVN